MGESGKGADHSSVGLHGSTLFLIAAIFFHPALGLASGLLRLFGVSHPWPYTGMLGVYTLLLAAVSSTCYGVFYLWKRRRGAWQFGIELAIEVGLFFLWPVY